MDRRRVLVTLGSALSLPLAGCVVGGEPVAGTTALSGPTRSSDGAETHLEYARGGETVATMSLLGRGFVPEDGEGRFRLSVSHDSDLRAERLRYRLRAPAGDLETAVELYLQRPSGDSWPPITFSRADDPSRTLVAVDDLGRQGIGTVTLDFLADTAAEVAGFDLTVDALATFSGFGVGQFTATGTFEHRFEQNA
ncbi:hypothetical protein [Halorientalis pallida]|uniref:DUF8121 domain-containing protein n=1 Tax=Halorientalis pallida TaxID=2479928 RepID=A0A498KYW8_9EURY|nr:hypothetical protein [Halorientalis pallida]RXK51228.1 hypothetical protein EAF64_00875 [Halorientalis pallida]